MTERFTPRQLRRLIESMTELREQVLRGEIDFADDIRRVVATYRPGARNLLHYLAMRQHDLRSVQNELAALGLSSLGRCEGHTLAAINAVLAALHRLADDTLEPSEVHRPPVDFHGSAQLLEQHTLDLFGDRPHTGRTYVMVTMPSEAADDPTIVRDLLVAGMDLMRINCAHDGPEAWARMVDHLRAAQRDLGRNCRVMMDLAGPKLRTGPIDSAATVVRLRPTRDERGIVTRPVSIWLCTDPAAQVAPQAVDFEIALPASLIAATQIGDELRFIDTAGRQRSMLITGRVPGGALAQCDRTAYIKSAITCTVHRNTAAIATGAFGPIRGGNPALLVHVGQTLRVTRDGTLGEPAVYDDSGRQLRPPSIPCTFGGGFADIQTGQPIWFDDGKIGGIVRIVAADHLDVEIVHASPLGSKLRAEKGINLPDTDLKIAGLTAQDEIDLAHAAKLADLVALSFVRDPADVMHLEQLLTQHDRQDMGIVLKIETRRAFERLPRLLLAALQSPPVGVMVARGDLAVEVGFERLAEVQEEILWICEAAQVPVIWATQVLETLAKTGVRSRAEVTDAAMASRAECVMLNKGPHIVQAVRTLSDILERMEAHQHKKRQMLRPLSVSNMA